MINVCCKSKVNNCLNQVVNYIPYTRKVKSLLQVENCKLEFWIEMNGKSRLSTMYKKLIQSNYEHFSFFVLVKIRVFFLFSSIFLFEEKKGEQSELLNLENQWRHRWHYERVLASAFDFRIPVQSMSIIAQTECHTKLHIII